jgi:hypothetical protein
MSACSAFRRDVESTSSFAADIPACTKTGQRPCFIQPHGATRFHQSRPLQTKKSKWGTIEVLWVHHWLTQWLPPTSNHQKRPCSVIYHVQSNDNRDRSISANHYLFMFGFSSLWPVLSRFQTVRSRSVCGCGPKATVVNTS